MQEGGVVGEGGVVFGEAEEGGEFVEFDGFFAGGSEGKGEGEGLGHELVSEGGGRGTDNCSNVC